jgi:hypothetical protein
VERWLNLNRREDSSVRMEDIMNASAARRMRFLSTCAAVIVAPGLLGSIPVTKEKVGFARSAKAASADFAAGLLPGGFGFPICRTPASGSDARGLIRLAQMRTEVPPSEMKAAMPAPEFANIAMGRARLHHVQDHDIQCGGAGLFRSGPAARLCVQSRRSPARVPQGAETRSDMRHVLLGRGPGAWSQYQSSHAG